MKKIGFLLIAFLMLVGCTQNKKETTFMITKDNQLYALYNSEGEQLTDYNYKTFEKVSNKGYLVTDNKEKKSFISMEGEEIITAGTYETIEAVDDMFYTTKKVEVKTETKDKKENKKKEDKKKENPQVDYNKFQSTNLEVLDSKGQRLYVASEKLGIKKSGLPILYDLEKKEYTVLYHNGEELYKGTDEVLYAEQRGHSENVVIGFKDNEKFYHFNSDEDKNIELTFQEKGTFQILDYKDKGVILNDSSTKSMIYVDLENKKYYHNIIAINDAYFDALDNIILTAPNKVFVYPIGKVPVLMNSYYFSSDTYVMRSQVVYGPHTIFKDGEITGELENCQFYPDAYYISSDIFPVYQKEKGYIYYNFESKKVIDNVYLEAEPFDANHRAIVKEKKDGYTLIDNQGAPMTKAYYNRIQYIGSSYYAVYNESGLYGVINLNGEEVLPIEYTSMPENPIVEYNGSFYLNLNKNGRGLVYDIDDDMKEIFNKEGNVVFYKEGYFQVGHDYYTFEGSLME